MAAVGLWLSAMAFYFAPRWKPKLLDRGAMWRFQLGWSKPLKPFPTAPYVALMFGGCSQAKTLTCRLNVWGLQDPTLAWKCNLQNLQPRDVRHGVWAALNYIGPSSGLRGSLLPYRQSLATFLGFMKQADLTCGCAAEHCKNMEWAVLVSASRDGFCRTSEETVARRERVES